MQSCPSDEQLRLLHEGALSTERATQLRAHVESCAQCRQRAARPAMPGGYAGVDTQPVSPSGLNRLEEGLDEVSDRPAAGMDAGEQPRPLADSITGYELTREIHRGGQGVVYQAIQKTTRRKVAIKVMREGPFAGARDKARFEREVQILATLKHPNIVAIHDSGVAGGNFYFVMDYISGQPLDVFMSSGQRSIDDTLKLFAKICEAVNAAHLRGVIHRDLKPGNIRIDSKNEPHVLDFGLAKMATGSVTADSRPQVMTVTGQFMGSLPWASPEQAEGIPDKIDIRTDVYSLGVILYQMLTGKFPYEVVGNMRDVLDRIMKSEPVRPSTVSRQVNDEVETIALKCLNKERDRRYQSAGELARDVQHYLAGEPIEAKRDSFNYMLRKHLHRYKLPVAIVSGFLILITASLFVSLGLWRHAVREKDRAQTAERLATSERDRADRKASEAAAALATADQARQAAEAAKARADEQAHALRRSLYCNSIALAQSAIESNSIGHAKELIFSCPPDLRNWEWYWLATRCDQSRNTIRDFNGWPGSVALSPDGTKLLSATHDNTLHLRDAQTGKLLKVLRGPANYNFVTCLAFSPNGKRIISGGTDGVLRLWDAEAGKQLRTLSGHSRLLRSVGFSPDGRRIISGGDDALRLWDAQTGKAVKVMYGQATRAAFSPDGRRIVSSSEDQTLKLWNADSSDQAGMLGQPPLLRDILTAAASWIPGKELRTFKGHTGGVTCVTFAPDGRRILSASDDGTMRIWDAQTGGELQRLRGDANIVLSAAFSLDGRRIVSGGTDGAVKVWDAETTQLLGTFRGHSGFVAWVAFSPDGHRILSACTQDSTLKFWHADVSDRSQGILGRIQNLGSAAFTPNGRRIVVYHGSDVHMLSSVELWDADNGTPLWTTPRAHLYPISCCAFSRDGIHIVIGLGDSKIRLWNSQTGEEVWTVVGHKNGVQHIDYSADGKSIISYGDWTVKLWDVESGKELRSFPWRSNLSQLIFTPDSRRFIAAPTGEGTLVMADV